MKSARFATVTEPIASTSTALDLALEALTEGDFRERWEAMKLFSQLEPSPISALINLLETEEDDWELCWFVARILGQFDHPEAIAALIDLLHRSDHEEVKMMAANTLANFGGRAIEPLTHLLAEPQWRRLAIAALAQTQHPEAIAPLLNITHDRDPAIRAATLSALQAFRDPRVDPIFIDALDDLSAVVRREAIIGLGLRFAGGGMPPGESQEDVDRVKRLESCLYDLDISVCQQAAIALSRCGTDTAALALFQVLQSPHTPVPLQVEIVRSLSWMNRVLTLEYLEQSLNLESPRVCLESIRALGQIFQPEYRSITAQILLNWWRSTPPARQHPEIRQAIAFELGRLGDLQALPDLQKLKHDPDPKVKIHAETAYDKCQHSAISRQLS